MPKTAASHISPKGPHAVPAKVKSLIASRQRQRSDGARPVLVPDWDNMERSMTDLVNDTTIPLAKNETGALMAMTRQMNNVMLDHSVRGKWKQSDFTVGHDTLRDVWVIVVAADAMLNNAPGTLNTKH